MKIFWLLCIIKISFLVVVAQENITAIVGQNVTLRCEVPNNNKTILLVKWSRTDLDKKEYVYLNRNGKFISESQHPSYENRTDLQDKKMKDGNVSLILMNVTQNDTGTYECRVVQKGTNRRKRSVLDSEPINIIHLEVGPSGYTVGIILGVVVAILPPILLLILLLAVAAAGVLIHRRCKKKKSNLPVRPDEAADEQIPMTVNVSAAEQNVNENETK